jgi:hypothetical protein
MDKESLHCERARVAWKRHGKSGTIPFRGRLNAVIDALVAVADRFTATIDSIHVPTVALVAPVEMPPSTSSVWPVM